MATATARRDRRRRTAEDVAPPGLREALETSRLNLRALFRALDRLGLAQELPPELRALFELDADFAEALWVLDQPVKRFDVAAMTRDTLTSLNEIPAIVTAFMESLSLPERVQLTLAVKAVRASLAPSDAYLEIPGRDPAAG